LFDIDPKLITAYRPEPAPGRLPGPLPREREGGSDGLAVSSSGNKLSNSVVYLLQVLAVRPQALERVKAVLDPANLAEDDRAAYLRLVSALELGGPDGLGQDLAQLPAE